MLENMLFCQHKSLLIWNFFHKLILFSSCQYLDTVIYCPRSKDRLCIFVLATTAGPPPGRQKNIKVLGKDFSWGLFWTAHRFFNSCICFEIKL